MNLDTATDSTAVFRGASPDFEKLSYGSSDLSKFMDSRIRMNDAPAPVVSRLTRITQSASEANGIQLRLFNAAAELKVAVAKISMHFPAGWRQRLFAKIDALYDADEWEDSDHTISIESFQTFLRTMLRYGPISRVSLGISSKGDVLAGWQSGQDTLALEFLSGDRIRWSVVQYVADGRESAAGQTTLERLSTVLRPYPIGRWISDANAISPQ